MGARDRAERRQRPGADDDAAGRRRGRDRVRARRRPPAVRPRLALERPGGSRATTSPSSTAPSRSQSDQKVQIHAKDAITIKSDKDFTLETTGKVDQKPQGDMTVDGSAVGGRSRAARRSRSRARPTSKLKCGTAKISMSAAGHDLDLRNPDQPLSDDSRHHRHRYLVPAAGRPHSAASPSSSGDVDVQEAIDVILAPRRASGRCGRSSAAGIHNHVFSNDRCLDNRPKIEVDIREGARPLGAAHRRPRRRSGPVSGWTTACS